MPDCQPFLVHIWEQKNAGQELRTKYLRRLQYIGGSRLTWAVHSVWYCLFLFTTQLLMTTCYFPFWRAAHCLIFVPVVFYFSSYRVDSIHGLHRLPCHTITSKIIMRNMPVKYAIRKQLMPQKWERKGSQTLVAMLTSPIYYQRLSGYRGSIVNPAMLSATCQKGSIINKAQNLSNFFLLLFT